MRWSLVLLGSVMELVAIVLQLRWHAAHPDTEPFGSILAAHLGIYAGAAIAAVGAAWSLADPRWRWAALLVCAGALLRLVAAITDMAAHVRGWDAIPFHLAYRTGIGLGIVGVLAGVVVALRAHAARRQALSVGRGGQARGR